MREGIAPYVDESESLGLSRSGWAWDARLADFDDDGVLEAVQALGFLKGAVNRWPELHEVAMGNDQLLARPASWHRFLPGDDLSGGTLAPFFVRARNGRYCDVAREAGLDVVQNTRGIAIADVDGDGRLDLAFGNQWEPSAFFRNLAPRPGAFLGLCLLLPVAGGESPRTVEREGRPSPTLRGRAAIGAVAEVRLADGRRVTGRVDGGSGHSGKRSFDVLLGLGAVPPGSRVAVDLAWRDAAGDARKERLELLPGWHTVLLESGRGSP